MTEEEARTARDLCALKKVGGEAQSHPKEVDAMTLFTLSAQTLTRAAVAANFTGRIIALRHKGNLYGVTVVPLTPQQVEGISNGTVAMYLADEKAMESGKEKTIS